MVLKLVQKPIYKFVFGPNGPIPLIDTRMMFEEEITTFFQSHPVMKEEIIRKESEKADYGSREVMPESITSSGGIVSGGSKVTRTKDKRVFDITYENPITHKMETLHVDVQTISTDVSNPVDKTLKAGSTYPVYKYITSPIYSEKIDQNILKDIRRKTEIVTPKPFGGGVAIPIVKVIEVKKSEALEEKLEEKKVAFQEVMRRERLIEKNIETKIVSLQIAVKSLKEKKPLDVVLERLPRRMRAILIIRLRRKRKVDNEIVEMILLDDLKFLEELKIKLKKMNLKQLIKLAKSMKKLTEKKG